MLEELRKDGTYSYPIVKILLWFFGMFYITSTKPKFHQIVIVNHNQNWPSNKKCMLCVEASNSFWLHREAHSTARYEVEVWFRAQRGSDMWHNVGTMSAHDKYIFKSPTMSAHNKYIFEATTMSA